MTGLFAEKRRRGEEEKKEEEVFCFRELGSLLAVLLFVERMNRYPLTASIHFVWAVFRLRVLFQIS
jgi:hypothetical protein